MSALPSALSPESQVAPPGALCQHVPARAAPCRRCSRREPQDMEGTAEGQARDVFNEKPSLEDVLAAEEGAQGAVLPRGAIMHTNRVRRQPSCCGGMAYPALLRPCHPPP